MVVRLWRKKNYHKKRWKSDFVLGWNPLKTLWLNTISIWLLMSQTLQYFYQIYHCHFSAPKWFSIKTDWPKRINEDSPHPTKKTGLIHTRKLWNPGFSEYSTPFLRVWHHFPTVSPRFFPAVPSASYQGIEKMAPCRLKFIRLEIPRAPGTSSCLKEPKKLCNRKNQKVSQIYQYMIINDKW